MKKIVLGGYLSTVMVLGGCIATPPMTQTTEPTQEVTRVIDVEGKAGGQIFDASKIWIAKAFKSANNVIQYEDKSLGLIIAKGNMQFPCDGFISCGAFGSDKINFTIKIETKDSKARINFSDITRTPLTYVQGGINTSIGREIPLVIVEHQKAVTEKLEGIAGEYEKNINSQELDSDW